MVGINFASVSVEPNKIKVGEVQTTRVEIESSEGVEKVSAQIPFEGSYDEIALKLIEGDSFKGVWEGKWMAHNTLTKEYETKIIAVTAGGKIETANATWWDDTETIWLEGWRERRKITVTENSGSELTDYQVPVDFTTGIYNNTGLVASWHFSEGSGTFTADSSGQGNNGTIYNGEIWTTNKQGEEKSALSFPATGNYINIEDSSASGHSLDLLENFTFAAWVYPDSFPTFSAIIAKRSGGGYQYELRFSSNRISLLTSSGSIDADFITLVDQWHYVAVTRDTVSGLTTLYVDGNSYSAANLGIAHFDVDVTIGKNADGTHIFNGSIDEVRIYNRALSETEIQQLYGEGKARLDLNDIRFTSADGVTELSYWLENDSKAWVKIPTLSASADTNIYYYFGNPTASAASSTSGTFIREIGGLAGSWSFSKGTGTTAYDSSGNGNNGAINGGISWTDNRYGDTNSALDFDGSDDCVYIADSNDFTMNSAMSAFFWVNSNDSSGNPMSIFAHAGDSDFSWKAGTSSLNSFLSTIITNDGDEYSLVKNYESYASILDGDWNYSGFTFNSGTLKLFINGSEPSLDVIYDESFSSLFDSSVNLTIGCSSNTEPGFFNGIIDDLLLFNRVLSSNEISDLYNNASLTVSSYPNKSLVYQYVSSGPTYSISSQEEKHPTSAGASGVSGGGPLAF